MVYPQRIAAQLARFKTPLPLPDEAALAASQQLDQQLRDQIRDKGPMPFAEFMQQLLYAPGCGYYAAGLSKFGAGGDFVTAPEISPLFSQALARQLAQLPASLAGQVLEIGAGRGRMAADMLAQWEQDQTLPERYFILEVSAHLRQVQRETLQAEVPHLLSRVEWLSHWPQAFRGGVVANEVLDAIPATLFRYRQGQLFERCVSLSAEEFVLVDTEPTAELQSWFATLDSELLASWGSDYCSEAPLWQLHWLKGLAAALDEALVLLIDYGFSRQEFFLAERAGGTLMCHYRHHAHDDALILPGLQDVTVHIDFTAIAECALDNAMQVSAYSTQAAFLQQAGILDLLQQGDAVSQYRKAQGLKRLLLPAEMGEIFKCLQLNKNTTASLPAMRSADMRWRL